MKHSVYIEHYTQKVPECDRLTREQAQEAWIRDVNPSNTATEKDSGWLIDFMGEKVFVFFQQRCFKFKQKKRICLDMDWHLCLNLYFLTIRRWLTSTMPRPVVWREFSMSMSRLRSRNRKSSSMMTNGQHPCWAEQGSKYQGCLGSKATDPVVLDHVCGWDLLQSFWDWVDIVLYPDYFPLIIYHFSCLLLYLCSLTMMSTDSLKLDLVAGFSFQPISYFTFRHWDSALPPPTKSSEFLMEATSDETCIIPLPAGSGNGRKSNSGKNKNKGSASKAGSSSSKKVDVGTYRLRTATKMITHLKFLQASFRELDSKVKEFYKEQADFKTKALSLKSSGVSEDRLLSDQSLQLGDDAALVKMMYNVLDRHRLLQFLSLGSDSMDVSDLEGGSADPSNGTENARKHIQSDPFLTEQCQGEVQAYVDIKNPEKIYESLNTKDCIDNQHEELMKVVKVWRLASPHCEGLFWILSRWSSLPTKRERDSKSKWLGLLAIQRVSPTEDCRDAPTCRAWQTRTRKSWRSSSCLVAHIFSW